MFHWTIPLKGGPCSYEHVAVVVGHKLYTFGRSHGIPNSDQYEVCYCIFNTASLRWRTVPQVINGRGECPVTVPSRHNGHTAVLLEDIVYIWGGYPYGNVLRAFDVDNHRWSMPNVYGTIPDARWYHSACVLEKVMYIYGGHDQRTGFTNDIYKLDTTTMVWALINTTGTTPPVSGSHSATMIGTKMFVFGGWAGEGNNYNNIRVFDTETNAWLSTPSGHLVPDVRLCHSAFVNNGELYIFGGCKSTVFSRPVFYHNDLWKFSPETFSWKQVEPKGKGPRETAEMCCCMVGDRIVIFGGRPIHDDVYILDLNPSLKTLCKLAVIQHVLGQSELPHDIRWELSAMTPTNTNRN